MVKKVCDFWSAGTVNGRNAFADTLIEFGLLSGSGLRARFFSISDSPGSLSEQDRANEMLPRHIVVVAELVLYCSWLKMFCFATPVRDRGKREFSGEVVRFDSNRRRKPFQHIWDEGRFSPLNQASFIQVHKRSTTLHLTKPLMQTL